MYNGIKVNKPWGYEFLLFETCEMSIWFLCLNKNSCTSLHCHPSKKTGLIVLNGKCEVEFLSGGKTNLSENDKIMIRHGVFHKTYNTGENLLFLLEVETPKNKTDLVRLEDNYGRAGTEYENGTALTYEDTINELQISLIKNKAIILNNKKIQDILVKSQEDARTQNIIIDGGIFFKDQPLASVGDVLSLNSFHKLYNNFIPKNLRMITIQNLVVKN